MKEDNATRLKIKDKMLLKDIKNVLKSDYRQRSQAHLVSRVIA